MKTIKPFLISAAILLAGLLSFSKISAQPAEKMIKVVVAPDHQDWNYSLGEKVKFKIEVLRNSEPAENVSIRYEVAPETMPAVKKDSLKLKGDEIVVDGGSMKEPGFLRCTVSAFVDGIKYEGMATAAYAREAIKPTTDEPADFTAFWDKAKAENAKIPMDVKLTLLPARCTEKVNVYEANIQNYRIGTRLYGILCVPKKEGKYPAVLKVPGAGVRPYYGDVALAEKGLIVFEIGIHGISVTMDPSVYNDLAKSGLDGYPFYNLDDKDRYFTNGFTWDVSGRSILSFPCLSLTEPTWPSPAEARVVH
jgi:hypothetical protein